MSVLAASTKSLLLAALLCACGSAALAQAPSRTPAQAPAQTPTPTQTPAPAAPPQIDDDEVIKVDTALIQTGVAVFDKKGQFVGNLKQEDFEVTVDGKPVAVSFFEPYTVRRVSEERPQAGGKTPAPQTSVAPSPVGRGRNVIFVVDDIHLSFDGHNRVKKMLLRFVEQEMTAEDTVAVASTTGRIGFLQQFTNDRTALRAAVGRLNYTRELTANDPAPPPMTEYEALLISQFDMQVTDIFAALEGIGDIESKRERVRSRARTILSHAAGINRRVYTTLEAAVRSTARLPGRKVVVFVSDGWLLDPANTDASYRMQRITDAAARTNAVIYSFDAKGLEAGFPTGTAGGSTAGFRVQSGERFEKQDGMSHLAKETGGRFFRNTNDLQAGLARSIVEASQHYLLAWRPITESSKDEKWRKIEVKVRNRPDLTVRVQGGYLGRNAEAAAEAESKKAGEKKADDKKAEAAPAVVPVAERELNTAATSLTPARELPVSLSVSYLDLPEAGASVTVAIQIDGRAVEFTAEPNDQTKANVDLLGLVYNADGKREKYSRELLTLDGPASALAKAERRDIYHSYPLKLTPGLYQVRVAARDVKSGRTGSAAQWVEIPDLTKRRLATSSVIISERAADIKAGRANGAAGAAAANPRFVVDRRVARNSNLRYITFVYNASRGKTGTMPPDVTVQTQILRGSEVVVTSQPSRISVEGKDPDRLPYAAEISLDRLPAGRYELLVLVEDRIAKTDSRQRVNFEVK